jgi:hypothetical protein
MAFTKKEGIASDLVRLPGSKVDSLHWKCDGCKHVVFWHLLTLCDGPSHYCDWCMAERGWERMAGSRPLVAPKPKRKKKRLKEEKNGKERSLD